MSTTSTLVPRARLLHWHHPEWCAVAMAAYAWLVLSLVVVVEPSHVLRAEVSHTPLEAVTHGYVMSTAMMTPLAVPLVQHVAVFSLWRRRYRAALLFLAGYLGVWTVVSAVLIGAAALLLGALGAPAATATAFALAVGAGAVPARRRLVRQCTAFRPLALHGVAGDVDCARFGMERGIRCVATCWPLMLAATVNHGLLVMAAATVLALAERRGGSPDHRVVLLGTLATGVGAVLLTAPW